MGLNGKKKSPGLYYIHFGPEVHKFCNDVYPLHPSCIEHWGLQRDFPFLSSVEKPDSMVIF